MLIYVESNDFSLMDEPCDLHGTIFQLERTATFVKSPTLLNVFGNLVLFHFTLRNASFCNINYKLSISLIKSNNCCMILLNKHHKLFVRVHVKMFSTYIYVQ